MRKKLMLAAAAVAVLAALLLLVRFLPGMQQPEQQPEHTETDYQSINLLQLNYAEITRYTLSSEQYAYTLAQEDGQWKWEERPEVPLDQSNVQVLLAKAAYFTARERIEENSGNLAQYGFDQPYAAVAMTLQNGETHTIYMGNPVSADNARYVRVDDSADVYLAAETMCSALICSVNTLRYAVWDALEPEEVQAFRLERDGEVIAIQRKTEEHINAYTLEEWEMTEPYQKDVNSEIFNTMVIEPMNFGALDYVEDAPASYAPYGLDNPRYRVTVTKTDGGVFDILLGLEQDGMLYAKLPDAPTVFTVNSTGAAFRDYSAVYLLESLVFSRRAAAVDHIDFRVGGRDYVLTFRTEGGQTTYYAGDYEKDAAEFLEVYRTLIAAIIAGEAAPDQIGAELCSYTFHYNNGTPSETVVFYEYGARYAAVSVNGTADFFVRRSDVQAMIDGVQSLF